MKKTLFYLIQFTWGLPQNLAGLIMYIIKYKKSEHKRFHNSFITYVRTDKPFGGVSFGIFIFVNAGKKEDWLHDSLIHEYGHTIQSLVLGPLWMFVIALPSVIWCNLPALVRYRKEKDVSYYALYCEGWSNIWGERFSGDRFISDDLLNHGCFGRPFYK